jgi:hypothetical protein
MRNASAPPLFAVSTRLGGARLLHTALAHAGVAVEDHVDVLIPAFCSSVGDEDADVAHKVVSCIHVLGAVVAPHIWLPIALDSITKAQAQAAPHVASALVVFAGLMHSAAELGAGESVPAYLLDVRPRPFSPSLRFPLVEDPDS